MKGFKKEDGKGGHDFIPTEDSSKKIHSGSIDNSSELSEHDLGFHQRGNKQLVVSESREKPIVKLENRANSGIRAYTEEVPLDNDRVVIEIGTNVVQGKFHLEPYWRNQEIHHDHDKIIRDARFDTFEEAKDFTEKVLNTKIVLDRENSNDYQTWEQNIKETEHELPFDRVFWHLPERQRNKIDGESIEDFVRNGIKKKTISHEFLREQDFNFDLL